MDLIEQAADVTQLKSKINDLIKNKVSIETKRIKNDNPGTPDSISQRISEIIEGVYLENLDGNNGLYGKLYHVFDKYLSEQDLKFVINFHSSDRGQKFSKVISQIIKECVVIEKDWSDQLKPTIEGRLKPEYIGRNVNIYKN